MEKDQTLLVRYAATRDADAFAEMARRHRVMVYATARRVTGNHHDAEDVTQACFFELAANATSIDSSVAGWLHSAATTRSIDVIKAAQARRAREAVTQRERDEAQPSGEDPVWLEIAPLVDAAFEHLPPELRIPLIMHFLERRSYREIAKELYLSKTTVERRIKIGLDRLRMLVSGKIAIPSTALLATLLGKNAMAETTPYLNGALAKLAMAGVRGNGLPPPALDIPMDGPVMAMLIRLRCARFGMTASTGILLLLTFATAYWLTQPDSARPTTYDLLLTTHRPYMSIADTAAFPAKIAQLAGDRGRFAQGTGELLFEWCRTNAADWFADEAAFVLCHGDIGLQQVGVGRRSISDRRLAVGLTSFDNAATLPIQFELFRAMVNLRVIADQRGVPVSPESAREVGRTLIEAFTFAQGSPVDAERELRQNPWLAELLARADRPYKEEIQQYSHDGRQFSGLVRRGSGSLRDVLTPAPLKASQVARLITSAGQSAPGVGMLSRVSLRSVKDLVVRTRVDSVSSQGQEKYLALLDGASIGMPHDLIVYVKQQLPSPCERLGMISATSQSVSQRVVEANATLNGIETLTGWTDVDGGSYTVQVRTPWAGEIDDARVNDVEDLLHAARIVGLAAGRAHASQPQIQNLITPQLASVLAMRLDGYWQHVCVEYDRFSADPRVIADSAAATDALAQTIARLQKEARP